MAILDPATLFIVEALDSLAYALIDPQSVKSLTVSKQWEPLRLASQLWGRPDKLPVRLYRKRKDCRILPPP